MAQQTVGSTCRFQVPPAERVHSQQRLEELGGLQGQLGGDPVAEAPDQLVGPRNRRGVERRISTEQSENYASDGPEV